eukprot:9875131-Lingulodinium_polyedra.AAC.1
MCVGLYTKIFTDPIKWTHGCQTVGVFDPKVLRYVMLHGIPDPPGSKDSGKATASTLRGGDLSPSVATFSSRSSQSHAAPSPGGEENVCWVCALPSVRARLLVMTPCL